MQNIAHLHFRVLRVQEIENKAQTKNGGQILEEVHVEFQDQFLYVNRWQHAQDFLVTHVHPTKSNVHQKNYVQQSKFLWFRRESHPNEAEMIWGDFAASQLKLNGKVGIGAVGVYPTNPLYTNYKLFVTGGILTDEIRVKLSASGTWAD